VTHDQEEALTMSNRIAVFNQGAIKQIGAPRDLYERPADTFVAGFVGVSNTLTRDGKKYMLRPEKIAISSTEPATPGAHKESGVVRERHYLGMTTRFLVALDSGETLIVTTLNDADFDAEPDRSDRVWVLWKPRDAIALTDA
jgi:putative spermidine/putrescine transport system ATP-binding protein